MNELTQCLSAVVCLLIPCRIFAASEDALFGDGPEAGPPRRRLHHGIGSVRSHCPSGVDDAHLCRRLTSAVLLILGAATVQFLLAMSMDIYMGACPWR